jgi:hypothetical protein
VFVEPGMLAFGMLRQVIMNSRPARLRKKEKRVCVFVHIILLLMCLKMPLDL